MWKLCLVFIVGLQSISGQTDPRCPPLNDPNNVVHLPHESDCTLFYKCNWGTPILFVCVPSGTHWSVASDRCEWPDVANCQPGESTTATSTKYPTTISTRSQEVTVGPTPDPRCPALNDPNNVVHLPHEYECTLFYKCNWGTPVLFVCQPIGTHWSVALDRCEWPDVANCQLAGTSTSTPISTTISTRSQEVTAGPTPDPRCPALNDPNNVVHLPHESECTLFYKCDWGTPVLFICQPFGTHWSVALNRCEVPSIAGCQLGGSTTSTPFPTTNQEVTTTSTTTPRPTPTTTTTTARPTTTTTTAGPITTTTTTTTTARPTTTTTSTARPTTTTTTTTTSRPTTTTTTTTAGPTTTTTLPPITLDPRCPAINVNGTVIHLPHEYDCTKYYTCDWGLPILMPCPPTLHWSVVLNRCDWPLVARCDESLVLDPRCPFPHVTDVMLPHETDCTKYYKCWWGLPDVFQCPINTHWSIVSKRCEDPFVAQCDPAFITTRRTMPTAPTVTSTVSMKRITQSYNNLI